MAPRAKESKTYGVNACRALFLRRPADILRVYLVQELVGAFGDLLSSLARMRRPYRIVAPAELEAITESRHHEGICIVTNPRPPVPLEDLLRAPGPACVIGLVEVGNPHNVGAILRTAAHFGVRGVLFLAAGAPARLSAAAARTSEGGAEYLDLASEADPPRALRAARAAGFVVAATSSHGGRDLYVEPLPPRLLLLVGAEDQGLPEGVTAAADLIISVPGTGQVESLNVAAATAVILGEHWRGRTRGAGKPAPSAQPARAQRRR
jgi:TrmH RNA methyltransferase